MTPDLHAYYRAQAYAFLSTCEGYNRVEFLRAAAFWILKARHEQYLLEFTFEDLAEWMGMIFERRDQAYEEAGWLDRFETEKARDGVLDAAMSGDKDDSGPSSLKMQKKPKGLRLYVAEVKGEVDEGAVAATSISVDG